MIRVTRRRVLLAVLALFLSGVCTIAWTLAGLPPVKYYLRYGLDPYCEPTGNQETYEGVEFIEIGPGVFRMGSTYLAEGGDWLGKLCAPLGLPWGKHPEPSNEMPVHWVEFRRGFWIATTETTNEQYERFRPNHERTVSSDGDRDPVVNVSWWDARQYCAWLSAKSGLDIRLPTESEWECATRAGSRREFCFGDDESLLGRFAWYEANALDGAREVGTRRENAWGLLDLHGNVWEWCEDAYYSTYRGAPSDGTDRTSGGDRHRRRVYRGGCWFGSMDYCRSSHRGREHGNARYDYIGFRPALTFSND